MWYEEAVVYQIYPLGLCGAPLQNSGDQAQADEHRILRVLDWVEHIKKLGATCVLFNPLFESDAHGYDTRDYLQVDCRLGTREDLQQVCGAFHQAGLRVVLDGVFNYVGRGFWAFRDVQEKKWNSPYKDWFCLSFDGNSPYNDGFWYDCWEGCQELVKLNLGNPAVRDHLHRRRNAPDRLRPDIKEKARNDQKSRSQGCFQNRGDPGIFKTGKLPPDIPQ